MPMKSPRWKGSSLAKARALSSFVPARIISRIASIRSPSKNICSVRQSPMPSAPNATAFVTCSGVSAFCAHSQAAELICPLHQFRVLLVNDALFRIERTIDQHLNDFRRRGCDFAGEHLPRGSIDGDVIASIKRRTVGVE